MSQHQAIGTILSPSANNSAHKPRQGLLTSGRNSPPKTA